jgi:hypothetical protein
MGVRKLTGIIAETMPAINPNDKVQFSAGGAADGRKIASGTWHFPIPAPLWRTKPVQLLQIAPKLRNAPQKRERSSRPSSAPM